MVGTFCGTCTVIGYSRFFCYLLAMTNLVRSFGASCITTCYSCSRTVLREISSEINAVFFFYFCQFIGCILLLSIEYVPQNSSFFFDSFQFKLSQFCYRLVFDLQVITSLSVLFQVSGLFLSLKNFLRA